MIWYLGVKVRFLDMKGFRKWTLKYIFYSKFDFQIVLNDFVWKIRPRRDSNPRPPDPLVGTHIRWVRSYHCATRPLALLQRRNLISTQSRLLCSFILVFFSSNHKSDVWVVIYCIYYLVTHVYQTNPVLECAQIMHTLTHVLCLLFRLVSSVESPLWVS